MITVLTTFWNNFFWQEITGRIIVVLVGPILFILLRPLLGLNIDTSLFVAVGISNFIVLIDIIKEFSKKNEHDDGSENQEESEFNITLFFQLIVLSGLIGFSLSFIFEDIKLSSNGLDIFLFIGLCLMVLSIPKFSRKKYKWGNSFLFIALVSFTIIFSVKYNNFPSSELGPPVHLIGIPVFFLLFDGIRYFINKVADAQKDFKLDIGLFLVGITTYVVPKYSIESLPYFDAGSAAAIIIIGNYFYIISKQNNESEVNEGNNTVGVNESTT